MLYCSICQDGINESPTGDNYPLVLQCGHVYHKLCINQSLQRSNNNKCPNCRSDVRTSFRLYPQILDRDETITFLQECAQNAELMCARQKKMCQDKDNFIQAVQSTLENSEMETRKLRTSYEKYVAAVGSRTEKLNADVKKLQGENKSLKENLSTAASKASQHEATIKDLQGKLQVEKDLFTGVCKVNIEVQAKHKLEIQALTGQIDRINREALVKERAKDEEIKKLRAKVHELQSDVARANEQIEQISDHDPIPRRPDPEVNDLALDLEKILLPSSLPGSRKRRNTEEIKNIFNERDESSVKQLRSGSEDTSSPQDGDTTEDDDGFPPSPPQSPTSEEGANSRPKKEYVLRKVLRRVRVKPQSAR